MSRDRWMRRLAGLAVAVLLPAIALAGPSPGGATAISLGSTLLPCAVGAALFVSDSPELGWALTAPAILAGPAAGYFYGGMPGRAFPGIGFRAGVAVVGLVGVGSMFDEGNSSGTGGAAVAVIAAAGVVGSVAIDLALVGRDVRERNQRRGVAVVPWRSRDGSPGLALRTRF
jgi:hypothetical protein